jgi:hypothetical protein
LKAFSFKRGTEAPKTDIRRDKVCLAVPLEIRSDGYPDPISLIVALALLDLLSNGQGVVRSLVDSSYLASRLSLPRRLFQWPSIGLPCPC